MLLQTLDGCDFRTFFLAVPSENLKKTGGSKAEKLWGIHASFMPKV